MTTQDFKKQQKRLAQKRLNSGIFSKELMILAEGDSWFDYPFKKDVADYLIQKGYAVHSLARRGDTLENMLYGKGYKKMELKLKHNGATSLQASLNAVRKHKPQFCILVQVVMILLGKKSLAISITNFLSSLC